MYDLTTCIIILVLCNKPPLSISFFEGFCKINLYLIWFDISKAPLKTGLEITILGHSITNTSKNFYYWLDDEVLVSARL